MSGLRGVAAPEIFRSNARRDGALDALRASATLLVLFHHTAITYGASGDWYYTEVHTARDLPSLLLSLFTGFNQAFFMGLFFLLAGYFTPGAVERHGAPAYARERILRLGLPLIVYFLLLSPITIALAATARGHNFFKAFVYVWTHGLMEPGPLWFCQALLIFAGLYLALRVLAPGLTRLAPPSFPSNVSSLWLRSAPASQPFYCASSGRRERRSSICSLAISRAMSCCSRPDASQRRGQASTRRRRSGGGCGSRSHA
jgi:fucose 4-O-acetylase-like acetyltransferase